MAGRGSGTFSLGMRQRLGIAAALLGDPRILLLDEPVNGLDPEGVLWIRTLMRSLAAEGRTVLVSSHLMSEMALTADHLIVIGRGRLIADTGMAEFLDQSVPGDVLVRSPQNGALADLLRAQGAAVTGEPGGALSVTGLTPETVSQLAAALRPRRPRADRPAGLARGGLPAAYRRGRRLPRRAARRDRLPPP